MAIGHRSEGANDQAGEDLRFLGFGLGSGFLVLMIVVGVVVIVFGSLFGLGLSQSLGEFALAAFHVNRDAIVFSRARSGTVHEMRTTGLINRS